MNRGKLGCTINLRHPDGKELFRQLVAKSDVVVDNFSSGVLERLGFSFEELQNINPAIVQAVMPGLGARGSAQVLGRLGLAAALLHGNHAAVGISRLADGNPL